MVYKTHAGVVPKQVVVYRARIVLVSFLLTFVLARIVVFLIMSRRIPDLYLYLGGTHIHHLNHGIFLLAGVGAYLLFRQPSGREAEVTAVIYGIGMALTFDEFGMWLHLGGDYWQRASMDVIGVLCTVFGLIAFAPSIKQFRQHNWIIMVVVAVAVVIFFVMLFESFHYVGKVVGPKLHGIEPTVPR